MTFALILPAAGKGVRLGRGLPKALVRIAGRPLLVRTLEAMRRAGHFDECVVAADPERVPTVGRLLARYGLRDVRVVAGGRTRAASVLNALRTVRSQSVLVHDAARPFVPVAAVRALVRQLRRSPAAIVALPVTSTVKRSDARGRSVRTTEDRRTLFLAQTPQGFRTSLLRARYARLGAKALTATDEAQLFDGTRTRVRILIGHSRNFKITTPDDLALAEVLLKK